MSEEGGATASSIGKRDNFASKFLSLKQELEKLAEKIAKKAEQKKREEEEQEQTLMHVKARELLLKLQEILNKIQNIYVIVSEQNKQKATCNIEVLEEILVHIGKVYNEVLLDIVLLRINFNFEELKAQYATCLENNNSGDIGSIQKICDVVIKDMILLKQKMGQVKEQVLADGKEVGDCFTELYDSFVPQAETILENISMTNEVTLKRLQAIDTILNEHKESWAAWCKKVWQGYVGEIESATLDLDNLTPKIKAFWAKSQDSVGAYSSVLKLSPKNVNQEYLQGFLKEIGDVQPVASALKLDIKK